MLSQRALRPVYTITVRPGSVRNAAAEAKKAAEGYRAAGEGIGCGARRPLMRRRGVTCVSSGPQPMARCSRPATTTAVRGVVAGAPARRGGRSGSELERKTRGHGSAR